MRQREIYSGKGDRGRQREDKEDTVSQTETKDR